MSIATFTIYIILEINKTIDNFTYKRLVYIIYSLWLGDGTYCISLMVSCFNYSDAPYFLVSHYKWMTTDSSGSGFIVFFIHSTAVDIFESI